jgi:hypothetical protein
MTESNLIEFRSDGGHEVGDFEANRDDPGTLDVGRQGGIEERRSTEVFQNLKINKVRTTQAVNLVRLIQWGTIVKGFPIAHC